MHIVPLLFLGTRNDKSSRVGARDRQNLPSTSNTSIAVCFLSFRIHPPKARRRSQVKRESARAIGSSVRTCADGQRRAVIFSHGQIQSDRTRGAFSLQIRPLELRNDSLLPNRAQFMDYIIQYRSLPLQNASRIDSIHFVVSPRSNARFLDPLPSNDYITFYTIFMVQYILYINGL